MIAQETREGWALEVKVSKLGPIADMADLLDGQTMEAWQGDRFR